MIYGTGYIPRDFASHPSGYEACAPAAPDSWLVPENEQEERLKEQKANKASFWDLREEKYETLRSLDQGQFGLCWAFSTTKAAMYVLAASGQLDTILSAWYVAGKANGWKNQGGWNTMSLKELSSLGAPPMAACPSFDKHYDNAEVAAEAAKNKIIEWYDGTEDRDRNRQIMISAMLLGHGTALDFNHLSHSMAGCYLESINPLVMYTDNSWNAINQYGPKGTYKLTGSKAIPDNISVARVVTPRG